MTENIAGALAAAERSSVASTQMVASTQPLSQQSERMRREVEAFVTGLRAA